MTKHKTTSQLQERVWQMRHDRGWSTAAIARRLGVGRSAVNRLLARAARNKGLARVARDCMPRRRLARPIPMHQVLGH